MGASAIQRSAKKINQRLKTSGDFEFITNTVPWVPETFLARFPVLSSLYAASAYGRRCVGLRPTPKIAAMRAKKL